MPDQTIAPTRPHQEWHRLTGDLASCLRAASEIAGPALVAVALTDDDRDALRDAIRNALVVVYDMAFQHGRDSFGIVDDADKLWAVHHQGADDIIAQPDRAAAERLLAFLAEADEQQAQRERPELAVYHRAVLVEWPFPADQHAAALADQEREGPGA